MGVIYLTRRKVKEKIEWISSRGKKGPEIACRNFRRFSMTCHEPMTKCIQSVALIDTQREVQFPCHILHQVARIAKLDKNSKNLYNIWYHEIINHVVNPIHAYRKRFQIIMNHTIM